MANTRLEDIKQELLAEHAIAQASLDKQHTKLAQLDLTGLSRAEIEAEGNWIIKNLLLSGDCPTYSYVGGNNKPIPEFEIADILGLKPGDFISVESGPFVNNVRNADTGVYLYSICNFIETGHRGIVFHDQVAYLSFNTGKVEYANETYNSMTITKLEV